MAATALAAALALGAGELYFRLRTGAGANARSWTVYHPDRGWALEPGEYVHVDENDFRATRISINPLGLRNPPLTLEVPAGRRRVSVLGDSFVFGAGLDGAETIPGRLGALLGERCEAVNLGVEGYGTGTETLLLEDLVARGYAPGDAIVLVFFTNDILDNAGLAYGTGAPQPHVPRFWVDSTGALRHTRPAPGAKARWGRALERRWMFLRYLRTRATNLVLANRWMLDLAGAVGFHPDLPRTPAVVEAFYGPGWEERWRTTEGILTYLSREASGRLRSRLYVAFVPSPFQVVGTLERLAARRAHDDPVFAAFLADRDRPQRCLREFCARSGLPFIDATPRLRQGAKKRPPYLLEAHLNAFGAGIVAAAIRDGMSKTAPP
ncbi:MAG TPA: hypothetical protein VGK89_03205 [Candidatus Eisenbacteria bacterium]